MDVLRTKFYSGDWRHSALKRSGCGAVFLWACVATVSWAHDPFEITSTASLFSNRVELVVEMEFNAAMALAGVLPEQRRQSLPESLFDSALPRLRERIGAFFQIDERVGPMTAVSTNVVLSVENHVKCLLTFPPIGRPPLRIHAAGLGELSKHGPFGVTLTVLDMVQKKVLSQSVLMADQPMIEVGAQLDESSVSASSKKPGGAIVVMPEQAQESNPPIQIPRAGRVNGEVKANWRFIFVALLGAGAIAVVGLGLRRKG